MLAYLQISTTLVVLAALTIGSLVFLAGGIALLYFQPPWLPRRKNPDQSQTPPPDSPPTGATPPVLTDSETNEAMRKKNAEESATQDKGDVSVTMAEVAKVVEDQLKPLFAQLAGIENKLPEKPPDTGDGGKEQSEELKMLGKIHEQLEAMSGRWTEEIQQLPTLFLALLNQRQQEEEQAAKKRKQEKKAREVERKNQEEERKRQEEEQKRQEEERKRREEMESHRELRQGNFANRFEAVTSRSDLYGIASLIKELTDDLQNTSASQTSFAEALPPYLSFVSKVEAVRGKLSNFKDLSGEQPEGAADEVEAELKDLERSSHSLSESHNAAWFINLLEESGRYPALRDKADRLKQLLNLEDVPVETDTEVGAKERKSLQVEDYVGSGPRAFIHKVLEGGYRLKGSETVIKQPKVIVRLES